MEQWFEQFIFHMFYLFPTIFSTSFWTKFGFFQFLITNFFWYVLIHSINPLSIHFLKFACSNKGIRTPNTICQCNAWCNVSCFCIHCSITFMWYVAIYTNLFFPHSKDEVYNLVDILIINFMWIDIVHQSIFYTRWRGFKGHIIWKTRSLTSSTHEINSSL